MADGLIALKYLLDGSKQSLENVMLNRMAAASMRRKELMQLLDEWAEKQAEAMLVEWFLVHGEELMGAVTRPITVTELTPLEGPAKPGPMRTGDLRDSLRRLLDSA